jgi:NADPH:quinone reductase-like Zn-dependent oxidoreductase
VTGYLTLNINETCSSGDDTEAMNKAIYVDRDNNITLQIREEQYDPVGGQALVRVEFSGVNPADLKHGQHFGLNDYVCGYELCGTVIKTGPSCVFHVGDVIYGSNATNKHKPRSHGAHQAFAIAEDGHMWALVPQGVPHSHAAVVSIVARTAADALFNLFGAPMPGSKSEESTHSGGILVWGGASSVGVAAIQLAKAAGLSPILTTASMRNHDTLLRLGATECFDYHDPHAVDDIQRSADAAEQALRYIFDTVVTRGANSTTSNCDAITSTSDIQYACVMPVPGNPRWRMAVAARAFDFPSPGGFMKGQPEMDIPLQKATNWALSNYGKGFLMPNVRVVKDSDAALEAIRASAEGKVSFEKVAIQHPL